MRLNPHAAHTYSAQAGLLFASISGIAAGTPRDEILVSYPSLASDDIEVSIAYAAELARERVVPLAPGAA